MRVERLTISRSHRREPAGQYGRHDRLLSAHRYDVSEDLRSALPRKRGGDRKRDRWIEDFHLPTVA